MCRRVLACNTVPSIINQERVKIVQPARFEFKARTKEVRVKFQPESKKKRKKKCLPYAAHARESEVILPIGLRQRRGSTEESVLRNSRSGGLVGINYRKVQPSKIQCSVCARTRLEIAPLKHENYCLCPRCVSIVGFEPVFRPPLSSSPILRPLAFRRFRACSHTRTLFARTSRLRRQLA